MLPWNQPILLHMRSINWPVSSQDQKAYLQAVKLGYMALLERYDEARKKAESEAQVNWAADVDGDE